MSMNFNEFCLAWKSQISMFLTFGLEMSEIIWNIKNQKWFGSGKVSFCSDIWYLWEFVTHLQRRTCQRRNVCGVFGKSSTWWFQGVWHSSTLSEASQCVQRFRPSSRHKWTLSHQLHTHLHVQSPGLEVIAWLRKLSTPVWVNWPPDLYQILGLF